jgi:drug/metabolite transporter (DMT)-like permease
MPIRARQPNEAQIVTVAGKRRAVREEHMIRLNTAYSVLAFSIVSVALSQLIIKMRFDGLGLGGTAERSLFSTLLLAMSDGVLWLGAVLLIAGACAWYMALTRLPIHVMLPFAAIITPVVSLGAYLFLGEDISQQKFMAIAVITAGVAWFGAVQ